MSKGKAKDSAEEQGPLVSSEKNAPAGPVDKGLHYCKNKFPDIYHIVMEMPDKKEDALNELAKLYGCRDSAEFIADDCPVSTLEAKSKEAIPNFKKLIQMEVEEYIHGPFKQIHPTSYEFLNDKRAMNDLFDKIHYDPAPEKDKGKKYPVALLEKSVIEGVEAIMKGHPAAETNLKPAPKVAPKPAPEAKPEVELTSEPAPKKEPVKVMFEQKPAPEANPETKPEVEPVAALTSDSAPKEEPAKETPKETLEQKATAPETKKTESKAGKYVAIGTGITAAIIWGTLAYLGLTERVGKPLVSNVEQKIYSANETLGKETSRNKQLETQLYNLQNDPELVAKNAELKELARKCDGLEKQYLEIQKIIDGKNNEYAAAEGKLKLGEDLKKLIEDYEGIVAGNKECGEAIEDRKRGYAEEEQNLLKDKSDNDAAMKKDRDMFERHTAEFAETLKQELEELVKQSEYYRKIIEERKK